MRRILALIIIFSLFALPLHAEVTGSVSLANIRLSLVSTAPFVDFSAEGTLTPYLNWRLTLTDSAGKTAKARILSAGTGSQSYIYAIGDSLTYAGTYETYLGQILGNNWVVVNKGIGGQTTAQILARFTADVITPGNAEYVIIWAGINDVAQDVAEATIESNLQAMYTAAHNAGITVISVNLTPFKGSESWSEARQIVLESVNAWIAGTATNIDYKVDAYALLEDPGVADTLLPRYDGDHVHLSALGYGAVADAVSDAAPWTHTGGETVGADIVAGWDLSSGWAVLTASITSATGFTNTAASGGVYITPPLVISTLYKTRLVGVASAGELRISGNAHNPVYKVTGGGAGYGTAVNNLFMLYNGGGGVGATNTVSRMNIYPVQTPSPLGVVTSAWTIESGFNYNDASGYTYRLIPTVGGLMMGLGVGF